MVRARARTLRKSKFPSDRSPASFFVLAAMADIGDDIFFASILEINKRLRAKEFTAVELSRAFCDDWRNSARDIMRLLCHCGNRR